MSGLEFGWLNGALGVILRGAAMTLFLIAVTTVAGTLISIVLAARGAVGIAGLLQSSRGMWR